LPAIRLCARVPVFSARSSERLGWRECRGLSGTVPAYFALPRASLQSPVERLRCCVEGERVVYRLLKSRSDGMKHVELAVSELFDRLAALIPPPRRHPTANTIPSCKQPTVRLPSSWRSQRLGRHPAQFSPSTATCSTDKSLSEASLALCER
jgi:hypothetical protein